MGTKNNPAPFDCYANAMPDEPMFILLARDPEFASLVFEWAARRRRDIERGKRPWSDMAMVDEAKACARAGHTWRIDNDGAWRKQPAPVPSGTQEK